MAERSTLKLGVMVSSLAYDHGTEELTIGEPQLCKALALAAKTLAIDLYLFQPADYNQRGLLTGYRYLETGWRKQQVPLPDLIYDRSFASSPAAALSNRMLLHAMHCKKPFKRLNAFLPSKWKVYRILKQNDALLPYLPETMLLTSHLQMIEQLNKKPGGLIIKPISGMQGRGIISIQKQAASERIHIRGRTRSNRPFMQNIENTAALFQKLHTIIKSRRYIMQPLLSLTDHMSRPFDIRILMQKDHKGIWLLTGAAIRCGSSGGVTSNLHGGGTAYPIDQFLASRYSKEELELLRNTLTAICVQAAHTLERRLGKFAELAFDFGLDQQQALWLLEVNSKPGRSSFKATGDIAAQSLSILQPLHYAKYLYGISKPNHVFRVANQGRQQLIANNSRLRPLNVQEVHR
ncbi:YheC/YheD family endospore coat-associated protein [Paenibacillus sp. IITD108]|uniref:YheC/YheD family endospore coat-associated protein n=1 Tax=Paenibacillus sp. IITD108 TaxID=3116649 RepID=UPI002F41E251